MGRAHGRLAREADALEAVEFFGRFLDSVFSFQIRGSLERTFRQRIRKLVDRLVEQKIIEQIPAHYRAAAEGFAEGSGLPLTLIHRAMVMPDAYAYLIGKQQYFFHGPTLDHIHLGCTSFVVVGREDGEPPLLHARNLDFPGGRRWTRHPAVIEYAPPDGQRYASVTALGIDTAGITAMNEAGLTLSLHMNYSTRVSLQATPIVILGQEVIRHARTLDDAVRILSGFRAGAGWSFVLGSLRERNAIVVEMNADGIEIRGLENRSVICANHYSGVGGKQSEYWISHGRSIDSKARYFRAKKLVDESTVVLTPLKCAQFLADSWDPILGNERAYGSTVCQVHTISSVVFEPARRRLFSAIGHAPVSKRRYSAFDLFPGPTGQENGSFEPHEFERRDIAREEYAQAHDAYFPNNDLVEAVSHLERACSISPQEGLYWSVLGLFHMKRGHLSEAEQALRRAIETPDSRFRTAQYRLFLARVLDLAGRRKEALEEYEKIKTNPDIGPSARRGLRKPWNWKRAQRLVIDTTLGDAIEPP